MSQQIVLLNPLELQQLINTSVRQAVREELKNISTAPEVMREKEAAKYLGLSPLTLKNYRSQGIGPVYSKNGAVNSYSKKDLDLYLQKSKIKIYNKN